MKRNNNFIAFFLLLLTIFFLGLNLSNQQKINYLKLSDFIYNINSKDVKEAVLTSNSVVTTSINGDKFKILFPEFYINNIIEILKSKEISFDFLTLESQKTATEKIITLFLVILQWLPILFFIWIFLGPFFKNNDKNSSGGGLMGGGNPFNFGKSKAKPIMPNDLKIKFDDVAGIDEAKQELVEMVDFLKNPLKYTKIGAKIPRGALLVGDPGTGKTMLAKAVACEANVPFFSISGSDFVEMFVGVGASRVRDMFAQAKKHSPCIIFIDEIDAVGRSRGVGIGGGNDEREQTLNQMLVEMDGFSENSAVIILAATNRVDVLDPALLRPGRFDRQISVSLPDIKGREEILKVHLNKKKYSMNINLKTIARGTPGFSGADLANIINEAAILTAKKNNELITELEIEEARDKVMMGPQRNMVMSQKEKELTAYHESGHAILAINLKASDPIHKATIIPRSSALGLVMRLPVEDRYSVTREKLIADIMVAMGGRIAEEVFFGYDNVTSGAASDIKQITSIARSMIIKWGLSDKLGMINYSDEKNEMYGNSRNIELYDMSDDQMKQIDNEVNNLISECYSRARKIIIEKKSDLEKLAKALLAYETLSGFEISQLIINNRSIEEIRNEFIETESDTPNHSDSFFCLATQVNNDK